MDALVKSAISHWAPRFVANGIVLTDFEEVTQSIASWDEWCGAWSRRAAVHEALGRETLAQGFKRSAGEHLTRAGVYYHFAKFLFVHKPDELRAAHAKAVECRNAALPLLDPPGERVAIPYAGSQLYGNLRKPTSALRSSSTAARSVDREVAGTGQYRPPLVIMCMGLDSAKEEMEAYEATFLARGVATLAFDGPGQGEGEHDWPLRGDYEAVVKAVVDFVETRADVDAARVGLWGVSLGGYFAPRAAAFEKRVKACIALSGPFDWHAAWEQLPALSQETFRVRSKSKTLADAHEYTRKLSLVGVAKNITCPLFVVAGQQDRLVPWQDALRLADEASGPVVRLFIEDGNHVANNRGYQYRPQTADWMATQLGVARH
ncbi:MAG: alpha/beta hydrolase family protein [Burkholderiales bacterium]